MKWLDAIAARLRAWDDTHNFTCDVCGREVFGGERVCAVCVRALPRNDGVICPFCGRKVREPGACLECKQKPLSVVRARSVCTHEGEAARLVLRFKSGEKYLFRTLSELTLPLCRREFSEADAVTFVPMTARAERLRGYNQSRLFAEAIARGMEKPLLSPAVKRKETPAQKSLGRQERENNLEGCFHIAERTVCRGKRFLIVDDTMTTGATASALAEALLRAGAKEAFLVTFTSVERKDPFGKPPRPSKKGKRG